MIKVKNLTYAYSRKKWPVLRDVSLEIQPGQVYGLLGKNGVGKSTLLYLMAGLLTPMKGVVTMDGTDVRRRLPSTLADIFLMPEEVVLPSMKLEEFVKLNAPLYPRFSEEDMARNLEIFDMERDVNLGELSMGQKKKVYMSFALACNTQVLLMDEPTNGLDIPGKEAFRRFVAGSMNDDRAIVISTHQVRDLEQLLDHIVILDDAKVILDRSIPEIAEKLKFTLTDSPEVIKSALLAVPSVGGVKVVTVNEDGDETEPDVEMLFNLVVNNQGIVQYLFRKQ
ncbi:ATP-binding cassette domain-containing protein [uncultured Duncaniella sp.]|uniref:ABC transporter ATP-binding protein n=1 Tax=uncultured Duncaniella sp. TaxID=2768039 RepID=UPI0026765A99|nr:ABC transporter ATP-binding protein [uncultured Duncaniella sp.]MCI9171540.1 ABC transporter ATP-binding protein [Muribaculaceae bacterium]